MMKKIYAANCLRLLTATLIITTWASVPAFSGGSAPEEKRQEGKEAETLRLCPEPRPQICTREYRPVCAQMQDGTFKTYSTGCTSCSDPKVIGYRDGACAEEK
jgi:hypothetical protein